MGTGTPVGPPPEPPTASAAAPTTSALTTSALTTSALTRRRLLAAAVAVGLVLALLTAWALAHRGAGVPPSRAAPASAVQPASPGAASAGDRLFPGLGNGGYDVRSYALDLHYPTKDPQATVTGSVTVTAVATQALSTFDLDYAGGAVGAVTVNGQAATVRRQGEELVVTPARPVPQGSTMVVAVDGLSTAPATSTGGLPGAHPFVATRDGTVLAGQPDGMHRFFPCNDHPSDKASFTFTVDVPAGWTAVANGDLVRRSARGDRVVWRYEQTRPMATELTQVAVGDFRVVERPDVDGVRLRDVVSPRIAGDLLPALAVQADELRWLTRQLGPYPFDVYGALVVDAKLGFALETQTLSLFDTTWFHPDPTFPQGPPDGVLVHEMAHQWFGDSVSPRIWSDVWLSEGHATWYAARWQAERHGAKGERRFLADLRSLYGEEAQFRTKFGPPARPLSGGHLFNPSVYVGGELVLYALRQTIGAAAFAQVERAWVSEHRDGVVSTADFVALASRVAGKNLTSFFDAWLYGSATPPLPALD